ncbi:MAG: glutamine synthetase [Paracoccaceae bacterium]|jgi:glutamine synthetase
MSKPERLRVLFCDHLNLARGKYVPFKGAVDGGQSFCRSTFGVQFDKDLMPSPGSMMLEGLPDMEARYLGDDIRDSWHESEKVVVGDLWDIDGKALSTCGRQALKRAIADWGKKGLTPMVGIELEAYAFQFTEDGGLEPYDNPGGIVYGTGPFTDPAGFTYAIWDRAIEAGFRLDMITAEYDTPQFEFTLSFDEALKAADDVFLFRQLAREVALEHGILLTFLPKPLADKGGNGMHINFSFRDKDGTNVVGAGDDPSDLAKGCIAGLIHHHLGITALLAPTVTSYQRLQPAGLAGVWNNWAVDHRGVTTRISREGGAKARLEHRMADATANIYTAIATVLQAARLGVENGYDLPPAETQDCFEGQDATVCAPSSLAEALDLLELDTEISAAVGQMLVDNMVFMKRDEIEKTRDLKGDALRDWYIHFL